MKCRICNRFQGLWPVASIEEVARRRSRHHVCPEFTWDELQFSGRSCHTCQILVEGCRGCFVQHGINESDISYGRLQFYYPAFVETEGDANKELIFFLKSGSRLQTQMGGQFEIEMFVAEDEDCPVPDAWDYMPTSVRTSPRTDSAGALAIIKSWIADCNDDHDYCELPDRPTLPTRVIDVGLDDGVVKLVETKGAQDKYVCLSHCWGRHQIITSTTDTIQQRTDGIAWTDLSKTFQEAIIVTRALGFQYIWIDSLCIIQDSREDWEVESAKMAAVYSQSHLTIAATHSFDGNGGLFAETGDVEISGKFMGDDDYRLFFRCRIDHHLEMCEDKGASMAVQTWKPTDVCYPLLTRAWVYQERMLSTRILHFGRYEVFFECKSGVDCECGGISHHGSSDAAPDVLMKTELSEALYASNFTADLNDKSSHLEAGIRYRQAQVWRTMVSAYTSLRLTYASDRLPAIGGLAKDMSRSRKSSRYLAGLWGDTLNDDLLWVNFSNHRERRPHPRNAPTWSWASVENKISVFYWDLIMYSHPDGADFSGDRPAYEHFAQCDAQVTKSAVDEFGSIGQGILTLSGLVVKGVLQRESKLNERNERIEHNTGYYICFPGKQGRHPFNADYALEDDLFVNKQAPTEVLCLRMSRIVDGRTDHLVSMVLKECASGAVDSAFERVGVLLLKASPPPVDPMAGPFREAVDMTVRVI